MTHYFDSSFLGSLLINDQHSVRASRLASTLSQPIPFTPLHRHEVRNLIRLGVFNRKFDLAEQRKLLAQLDHDLAEGLLEHAQVNWTSAFREADRVSDAHTHEVGPRAIDLLHVGIALSLQTTEFYTFDQRQGKLAERTGLKWIR